METYYQNRLRITVLLLTLALLSSACQEVIGDELKGRPGQDSANVSQAKQEPTDPFSGMPVSGKYLKAFVVAYSAFKAETKIPPQKKRLENYFIRFSESNVAYFVLFIPNQTPNDNNVGSESELGFEVLYAISKKDFRLIKWSFTK
jgi:hypothetical protein